MQSLICIPFAIACSTKTAKSPVLVTEFDLRAYRYQLPTRLGEFKTEFGTNLTAKSDLGVFLTRPSEFGIEFQMLGTLEPRQNKVEISSEFAIDSTRRQIIPRFYEQLTTLGTDLSRYVANSKSGDSINSGFGIGLSKALINFWASSFTAETSLISNRLSPRSSTFSSTTEFGLVATRKQI